MAVAGPMTTNDDVLACVEKPVARRRRLHRERMARRRAENRVVLSELQQQEEQLSRQLQCLLATCPSFEQLSGLLESSVTMETQTPEQRAMLRFMCAVQMQAAIERENSALLRRLDNLGYLTRAVELVVDKWPREVDMGNPTDEMSLSRHGNAEWSNGFWASLGNDEPRFYVKRMTTTEAEEAIRRMYQKFSVFQQEFRAQLQLMEEVNLECFGWTVTYGRAWPHAASQEHRRGIRFRFEKRVEVGNVTLDMIADRTWRLFNTPEQYARLYRSPMQSRVLQPINDHASIVMRTWGIGHDPLGGRMIGLSTRLGDTEGSREHHPDGRRVLFMMSMMDPEERILDPEPTVTWIRQGTLDLIVSYANPEETAVYIDYCVHMDSNLDATQMKSAVMRSGEALIQWEGIAREVKRL